jgi:nucleoid-associated protein YgaU
MKMAIAMAAAVATASASAAILLSLPGKVWGPDADVAEPAGLEGAPALVDLPLTSEFGSPAPPVASTAGSEDPEFPRFDVVRVGPDGSGLVAGQANPGDRITLFLGNSALAEVQADPSGAFVATFDVPASSEPRHLDLSTLGIDGPRRSRERVLLLPPAQTPTLAGESWAERDEAEDHGASSVQPDPALTAILRPGDGVTDGRLATKGQAARSGRLSLATIDYLEEGGVTLAGYAASGARLRIYVDGAEAQEAVANEDGKWQAALDELKEGSYTLRVDAYNADGGLVSRVETPFRRQSPDAIVAEGSITVQPGNNLWKIARMRYGSGMHFTTVFTANADLIDDPDLIFPGQIFVLPDLDGSQRADEALPPRR